MNRMDLKSPLCKICIFPVLADLHNLCLLFQPSCLTRKLEGVAVEERKSGFAISQSFDRDSRQKPASILFLCQNDPLHWWRVSIYWILNRDDLNFQATKVSLCESYFCLSSRSSKRHRLGLALFSSLARILPRNSFPNYELNMRCIWV